MAEDNVFVQEIISLLEKLVSIPSPYFEEDEIMSFVDSWFKQEGILSEIHEYHEDKVTDFKGKNIVATLEGNTFGPTICLNGHLDTVKTAKGWTKNPYGQKQGDRFYGIGSLDMKAGCAATMMAMKRFRAEVPDFKGKIIATYVSVEEGPYGIGTNALIEANYLNNVDYSIVTEPSAGFSGNSFPDICFGARGGYGLTVEFFGKAAHAANPQLGISAAEDAASFIAELKNIEYIQDPKLGKGTACVVAIDCDGGACSVPDYASVKLFWHIVRGENPDTISAEIHKAILRADIKSKYEIHFRQAPSEDSKGFMPYVVDGNDPFTQNFVDIVRNKIGKQPSISYFQSIGDFNYLGTRIGAPVIIFGPSGKNYHSPDEYVDIHTVVETSEVILEFLKRTLAL